jgi:phenylalanyl-tRNA synthetase beta chain
MRVSLKWLNEYIDLSGWSADHIADVLTELGLEVESIEKVSPIGDSVVVGKIVSANPHPNADTLRVCKVDVGAKEPLDIVCGAPNARADIHVVVATVGSVLPGDFKIKPTKIRGETSNGMMASAQELGISNDHEGIIELPGAPKLGSPASIALGLEDHILTLKITPNRADCFGYVGLARDISAKTRRNLKLPAVLPENKREGSLLTADHCSIAIDTKGCGRFVALYIDRVKAIPAPQWMQRRLEAAGMRPINLIVDTTNYVMLESGQPIHAYDVRDLDQNKIVVRNAKSEETIVTLDGQTRKLATSDILICDATKAVGIAGVMGGLNSEVKEDTQAIIIEVANFDPPSVRATSKRLGLKSEASHRFERGVDLFHVPNVAWRVAALIHRGMEEANATSSTPHPLPRVAGKLMDIFPEPPTTKRIALRVPKARQLLGMAAITADACIGHLKSLGFQLVDRTEDRLLFEVPSWRVDIDRETDLIEEIGRLEGYDRVVPALPYMNILPNREDPFIPFQEETRINTALAGFQEIISFPFTCAEDATKLRLQPGHPLYPTLTLANPINDKLGAMQACLAGGLIEAVANNRRHGRQGTALFEQGRGYFSAETKARSFAEFPLWRDIQRSSRHVSQRAQQEAQRPIERHYLAGIIDQPWQGQTWAGAEVAANFFHGKDRVTQLLKSLGIARVSWRNLSAEEVPFLHPTSSASLWAGDICLGFMGELHPEVCYRCDLDITKAPIMFQLDLEYLFAARGEKHKIDSTVWKFPPVSRDLAFIVDANVTHGEFQQVVSEFKSSFLQDYSLFDVYQGPNVDSGKKSFAFSFRFRSAERTLTDKEIEKEVDGIISWTKNKIGAQVRGA